MWPALWLITRRQWRTHSLRVALTTLGIALGVAVFFAIRTANVTLLDSLSSTIEKLAGRATLEVSAGEAGFSEPVLDTVRKTPGVELAEPVIEVLAHTGLADEGDLLILGVDTTGDQRLRDYEFDRTQTQMGDPLVYLAQPQSLMLSRAFAERHGLKIGDSLPVYASDGKKMFTVQGIFQPVGVGEVFGGNIAVMDVYSAQIVFARGHNFDRIDLVTSAGVPVETVQQRLRAQLPAGVEVARPEVRGQELDNAVTALRLGMLITSFIALLVGTYIIFNSFTIAVNQRWKEIGVLRAVGVERRNVQRAFLGEALLMGVIGSAAGILGGYYLAIVASRVMGGVAAAVYGVVSTPERPVIAPALAATGVSLGVVASLAGAWIPARAASQLDPILALYNIEIRGQEAVLGRRRIIAGALLVIVSVLLIEFSPARVGLVVENAYAAITLLGLTLLLPKMVEWTARALRPVMDWMAGSEGALAVDAMIRSPRRSAATVGALMVGLMFVFSTSAYIQSYRRVIDRWTNQLVNADLVVTSSTMIRSTTYHFNEDLGAQIAALPGVRQVQNARFTAIPFRGDSAALVAIDIQGYLARTSDAIMDADPKTASDLVARDEGVLVSRNFATRWGMHVGDRLHLETPTGPFERPIAGFVEDYRSDKGTIFMDRELYKKQWQDSAVDYVDVEIAPGAAAADVKREIAALTAGKVRAIVYTNAEFKQWIASLVDQFFMLNYMQLVVAVFVAVLGIANTLVLSVAERRRELGIVRAIGGLRTQVRNLVLLEAVAISVVGVLAGALAGLFDTAFMSHTVSVVLAGYSIPFYFPWTMVLSSLPLVIAVSLIAGWWPAHNAVRMDVIEAIGYE